MRICFLIFLFVFFKLTFIQAQNIDTKNVDAQTFPKNMFRQWQGVIDLKTQGKLKMFVEFLNENSAKMDIPQQGAKSLKLQNVSFKAPDSVFFTLGASIGVAVFKGKTEKNTQTQLTEIKGSFTQNQIIGSFFLVHRKILTEIDLEKLPYTEKNVFFTNETDNIKLGGTLALPKNELKNTSKNKGKFPAVILVSGSGGQARDCEINDFAMFKVLSDYLVERGIAVLRYDDRGTGESKGNNVMLYTTKELAKDVESGVKFLSQQENVDAQKIGIIGHSEGGIIAPLVAESLPDLVAFVVLLGGTGVNGFEVLNEQKALIARVNGTSEKEIEEEKRLSKIAFESIKDKEKAKKLFTILYEEAKKGGMTDQKSKEYAQISIQSLSLPWIKFFMQYEPAPTLERLKCPVFAVFGEKDLQVSPTQNLPAMQKALKKNKKAKFYTFKKANHLFQFSKTGNPEEYSNLKPEYIEGFLPKIYDWLEGVCF